MTNKIVSAWSPPPTLKISEWADQFRYLPPGSPEPGRWRTSRAEYQREIMDAANDPEVEMIVVVAGSQTGKTEFINNTVGYFIHQDPTTILVVQPSGELANTWSKERFKKMVDSTPVLQEVIKPPRTKDSENTILHKVYDGGDLAITTAKSPIGLAARPRRIVLCDEVDRYDASAKTEGNPVDLAIKRTTNYHDSLVVLITSPGNEYESLIWDYFEASDQRQYHIPCWKCGEFQRLVWDQVKYDHGGEGKRLAETARYECIKCGATWNDAQRWASVSQGVWVKTNPEVTNVAGFQLPSLVSPWIRLSTLVDEWDKAQGNPEKLKVFINTRLAETYKEKTKSREWEAIAARRETYLAQVPEKGLVVVCGVDVQDDRFEGEFVSYGIGEETWGVDKWVIRGDLSRPDIWKELDEKLKTTFTHQSGIKLRLNAACIDTGGHYTQEVYKFCLGKEYRRIFAIKGANTVGHPLVNNPSRNNKAGVKLFMVGTDTAKEIIYGRLGIIEFGPGYMHFPPHYDEEYFRQLTSERAVLKFKNGKMFREWKVKPGFRNESLDCRVYAHVAYSLLNPDMEAVEKNLKIAIEKSKGNGSQIKEKPGKKNSWVNQHKG